MTASLTSAAAVRERRASVRWALIAAAALGASTALQVQASWQRWVTARGSWTQGDRSIEDHLYDYMIPADPWVSIGSAAQVYGIGMLLLAAGILAMTRTLIPRASGVFRFTSAVVAAVFGLNGAHALVSGLIGAPTPLQSLFPQMALALIPVIGLAVLAARAFPRSPLVAIAYVCLLGSTALGLIVSTFLIAPTVIGYQSHDTTPWSEAFVAASTALAGAAVLASAVASARPGRTERQV